MRKKQICLLTSIVALGSLLVGCGEEPAPEQPEEKEPEVTKYNVTLMNEDQVFKTLSVKEGTAASLPSEVPTKQEAVEEDGKYYTYTFSKWMNGENEYDWETPVTEDITLNATYSHTKVTCDVTFMDKGVQYDKKTVDKGSLVESPETNPSKEDDADNYYSFANWKNGNSVWNFSSDKVMSDLTLTSDYSATPRPVYTITFKVDGSIYTTQKVKEGFKGSAPEDPTKESTAEYTYSFVDWKLGDQTFDFANTTITSNLELVANFSSTKRSYTVKFIDGENELSSQTLEYGSTVTKPQDPSKSQAGYTITFKGWSVDPNCLPKDAITTIPNVTGEATYYSVYESSLITYTATIDFDYENAPEDEVISYTVEDNLEEKLAAINALVPEDEENYYYSFETKPTELTLENKTFKIVKKLKAIDEKFASDELPETLSFISFGEEVYSISDGVLTVPCTEYRNILATKFEFRYFSMEFDMKFERTDDKNENVGQGRVNLIYGATAETYGGDGILVGDGSNNARDDSLTFISDGKVRFNKEGQRGDLETNVGPYNGIDFTTNFVHYKVENTDIGMCLKVNDQQVFEYMNSSDDYGSILLTVANYLGNIQIKNLKVNVITESPLKKSFKTEFEGNKLPLGLTYIKNTVETEGGDMKIEGSYSIENQIYTANYGYENNVEGAKDTSDLLMTKCMYKCFDLTVEMKLDKCSDSDARINLNFGMPNEKPNVNHGQGGYLAGECIVLLPNAQGARWYTNGSSTRNDPAVDLRGLDTDYMTLKLSVKEGSSSLSINGGQPIVINGSLSPVEGYIQFTTNSDRQTTKMMLKSFEIVDTTTK